MKNYTRSKYILTSGQYVSLTEKLEKFMRAGDFRTRYSVLFRERGSDSARPAAELICDGISADDKAEIAVPGAKGRSSVIYTTLGEAEKAMYAGDNKDILKGSELYIADLEPVLSLCYDRRTLTDASQGVNVEFIKNIRIRNTDLAVEYGDYGKAFADFEYYIMIVSHKNSPSWLVRAAGEQNYFEFSEDCHYNTAEYTILSAVI